jgi:hypothetical protein
MEPTNESGLREQYEALRTRLFGVRDYALVDAIIQWYESLGDDDRKKLWGILFDEVKDGTVYSPTALEVFASARVSGVSPQLLELMRTLENSRWRDDILITLTRLGYAPALGYILKRIGEIDPAEPNPELGRVRDVLLLNFVRVDSERAIAMNAEHLATLMRHGRIEAMQGFLIGLLHVYMEVNASLLVHLLEKVGIHDAGAATAVRSELEGLLEKPWAVQTFGSERVVRLRSQLRQLREAG